MRGCPKNRFKTSGYDYLHKNQEKRSFKGMSYFAWYAICQAMRVF